MKIVACSQGSPEWKRARLGIPTASNFHKIVTPKTLELSKQRFAYMHKLLAEFLTGEPQDDDFATAAMERGTDLQDRARHWYAFYRECDVEEVGLCLTDDEQVGASPDGLVGVDGGLEIKCPMAPKCVAYLLGANPEEEHALQVQGGLFVTGLKWWDILVWNPTMNRIPPKLVRVVPDPKVQAALRDHLRTFIGELNLAKAHLVEKGCSPAMGTAPTVAELWK